MALSGFQAGNSITLLVSALGNAAETVTEVARIAKDAAVIADTAKRAQASISEAPRWVLGLVLGALGLGIVAGFLVGRRRRNGPWEAEPVPQVAESTQASG
jgi:hypothetical protein